MIKNKKAKKTVITLLTVMLFAFAGIWYLFFYSRDDFTISFGNEEIYFETENTPSPLPSPTPLPIEYIYVHICGSVNAPGVVYVEKGSRLKTIVDEAGGFSYDADESWLNLARIVKDGERVYVPSKAEIEKLDAASKIDGEEKDKSNNGNTSSPVININTAGINELTKLPGIGESRAKDIINYRTKHGSFKTKEEIKNVSGIGDAMFERISESICVE